MNHLPQKQKAHLADMIKVDDYIDARPDGQYATRILERYRDRAVTAIKDRTLDKHDRQLGAAVRGLNKRRVVELNRAIGILKGVL